MNPSAKALQAAEWWAFFLRTALAHPKGACERRAAISALAGVETMGPDGRPFTPSLRDIERKVSKATAGGIRGLMRKRREVRAESLPILTRRWDAATIALADDVREAIARRVRQRIRDLWGSGAAYSVVQRLAGEDLTELTLKAGIGGEFAVIMPACELPKGVVEAGRDARRVHKYRTDRKAWTTSVRAPASPPPALCRCNSSTATCTTSMSTWLARTARW